MRFNFCTNSLVSNNKVMDRQLKTTFFSHNFEVNFYLNSNEIHKKLFKTINMKYVCIQKDTFHNIEQSVFRINISSKIKVFGNGWIFIE